MTSSAEAGRSQDGVRYNMTLKDVYQGARNPLNAMLFWESIKDWGSEADENGNADDPLAREVLLHTNQTFEGLSFYKLYSLVAEKEGKESAVERAREIWNNQDKQAIANLRSSVK